MAIKRMQMYRRNLDGTETRLNPLTEAQYVSMENGQTVQEVLSDRDSDKYTPVITNSSSTFKVGQGDNVDLSSSMKEGAYDSCVLKGKTMVNCIQEPSSKDVVLPYEFADGRYVTINDTKESGALGVELKGQTLVNLVPKKIIDYTASSDWDGYHQLVQNSKQSFDEWRALQDLKPNTKYYISCYVETFEVVNNEGYRLNNPSVESIFEDSMIVNGVGRYQWVSTTKSELTDEIFMALRCQNALARGAIKIRDIMIIEYQQGMENWDVPYFEGMASCKMPILHTIGKNLFDGEFDLKISSSHAWSKNFIKVLPNTVYIFSHQGTDSVRQADRTEYYNEKFELIGYQGINNRVTTPNDCHYIKFRYHLIDQDLSKVENTQLEQGTIATSYEPHKSSILSLPEEVVLRSLPNGAKDTLNLNTGEYVQRIKEVTFDGSNDEGWVVSSQTNSTTQCFDISVAGASSNNDGYIATFCDKFPSYTASHLWSYEKEGVGNPSSRIRLRLNATRLSTVDVAGLRTYLQSNPITVQYELATPIVTKINLPSTLKSWNTTTHIYSEIPENTLYPILSHSNPTYPVILKPSTKYSIVANSYSNSHTNSAINFNLGGATATTTVGNRVTTITTPSTLSNELLTMSGRGNKLNNVMVIEGDVVGDEPYFEGMCDSKSPILSNVGKNLFTTRDSNVRTHPNHKLDVLGENHIEITATTNETGWLYTTYEVKGLVPNTTYILSGDVSEGVNNSSGSKGVMLIHDFNTSTSTASVDSSNRAIRYTTPKDVTNVRVLFYSSLNRTPNKIGDTYSFKNIQLEKAQDMTTYEPYKSNTTTFNQKDDKTIVLRSLPNGVCDTLNVETGEYVQRIGERTLNGSEDWGVWQQGGDHLAQKTVVGFGLNLDDAPTTKSFYVLCDHFATGGTTSGANNDHTYYVYHKELIYGYYANASTHHKLGLSVSKTKLGIPNDNTNATQALAGLRTYLASNPVTVQYELATPIVSTIDVQGFPYAYTNGHVQLSSGSIEQSLTPKVEYSLSANKTGQIQSNTRQVIRQQNKLDDFEAMMLTAMVNSAYDKAILQFDYEMQMMSLGGE